MQRNLVQLSEKEFDLLIIGGGIYGATAAYEASMRGLSVALIEKGDFASGTSGNSLKIVHGGLRYLQHADFKRMRESISERKTLLRIAPHLVHPLPCVMPTYGHFVKGPEAMGVAMIMNDLVSMDRNWGMDAQKRLPAGKTISKEKLLTILPYVEQNNLNGGAIWYDGYMYNSERLALAFIQSAVRQGAVVANYVMATSFLRQFERISGVKAVDQISGKELEIRARMTLTCAGPWINSLFTQMGVDMPAQAFSTALNLVVKRRLSDEYAFGVNSRKEFKDEDALIKKGSRLLFVVPWRNYSMIGTAHKPFVGEASDYRVSEADIEEFLQDANAAMPGANIQRDEVTYFYGGLLPMAGYNAASGDVRITKHFHLYDHEKQQGLSGVLSVLSVKYTTARGVSQHAIEQLCRKLGCKKSQPKNQSLWGGDIPDFAGFMETKLKEKPAEISENQLRQLVHNYGSSIANIYQSAGSDARLLRPVAGQDSVLRAEVVHAVREEMAMKLTDVVLRRTELGSGEYPGDVAVEDCARLMAAELNWDEARVAAEIRDVRAVYKPA
jgi:glycerol-3-phosphate dehydrogenase